MTIQDKLFIIGALMLPAYFLQALYQKQMGYEVSDPVGFILFSVILIFISFIK